jgi:type I restriction enzyme S subunit
MEVMENIEIEKYAEYKDSGVEWLGEIPKHWELSRLATRFSERKTKVSDKDFEPLSVTKQGILPQLEDAAKTNDGDNRKLVKKGDFVINSRSDRKGSSGISSLDGSVSLINIVLEPKGIDPRYCNYLLKSNNFIEEFYRNGHGIVADLWTTRYDDMKLIKVAIPPLTEQTRIAQFLDRKTTQIDKAIAQKEKLIELLKERRQILIHNAVTRGLNPNVKMKPSGVEWIGEIPEHWEVNKLLGLCNFIRGNSSFGKDELLNDGEYVALQYGKIYKINEVNEQYNYYVNNEFYKASQIVHFGDTIIISTSETIEDLGHTAYFKRNDLGLIGGEQILLKPNKKKINSYYLFFSSKVFSKELRKFATGIKVFRFNMNDLKTIYNAVPPLSEQQQIVEYIESVTKKIATAISLKEQEIEKLKEYRSTLINSTVTGKIKVI